MNPHVMLGMTAGDRMCTETAFDLVNLVASGRDILANWSNSIGSYISHEHDALVHVALLDSQVEHLMFIDCDQRFPPDAIHRLLAHDKDIVGATYRQRRPPHELMLYRLPGDDPPLEGLREMAALPSGVLLVRTKVFRETGYPWFFETYGRNVSEFTSTDINFCNKARAAGFRVWCDFDLSREVSHLSERPLAFYGGDA